MGKTSKTFALMLALIIAVSCLTLLTFKPANAQTPVPSVPQFTVRFVNDSYGVTTTNPYTGQSQTNQTIDDYIEITIQNQHFDYSKDGLSYPIFFNIRIKPHFSQDNWTELYPLSNATSSQHGSGELVFYTYAEYISANSPAQTSSRYTTIDFPVVPTQVYQASGYDVQDTPFYGIPIYSQLDFQVEALVGHNSTMWVIQSPPFYPALGGYYTPALAYDSSSGWSPTQTVTIGQTSAPASTVPEFPAIAVLPILISVFFVAVVAVIVRHRKTVNLNEATK